jgi:Recombination endonuclease VII
VIAALYVETDGARQIITRVDAKAAGLTRYFTGKPCKHGHVSDRDVSSHTCGECLRIKQAEWVKANPEKRREADRKHRAKNAAHIAETKKIWKAANRDKHGVSNRKWKLKRFGGIEVFDALLKAQEGMCAICGTDKGSSTGKDDRRLAVDHCHATGAVRGLLCGNCNRMLGLAKDSPDLLRKAAAYLEKKA